VSGELEETRFSVSGELEETRETGLQPIRVHEQIYASDTSLA
jgi:hypothetical protein